MKDIKCPKCKETTLKEKGTMETLNTQTFDTEFRIKLYCDKCKKKYGGERLIRESKINEYLKDNE